MAARNQPSSVLVPRLKLEKLGLKLEPRNSSGSELEASSPSVTTANPMIRAGGVPLSKAPSRSSVSASPWSRTRLDSGIGFTASQELLEGEKDTKPKEADVSEALALLRAQLVAAGPRIIIELATLCSGKANVGKDVVDVTTAVHILRSHRLRLTDQQSAALFAAYNEAGRVRLSPLIRDLLGPLPDRRHLALGLVFDRMDTDHDGVLSAADLRRALRIAHHPLVVTGQATLDQVHAGFLARALDSKSSGTTRQQFEEYHTALSSAFRRDEEFGSWLQKYWRAA